MTKHDCKPTSAQGKRAGDYVIQPCGCVWQLVPDKPTKSEQQRMVTKREWFDEYCPHVLTERFYRDGKWLTVESNAHVSTEIPSLIKPIFKSLAKAGKSAYTASVRTLFKLADILTED